MNSITKNFLSVGLLVCSGLSVLPPASAGVLTWDACVREALTNNPDLVSAAESVRQGESDIVITRSSLRPQINSSMSGGRSGRDSSGTDNSFSYGVSAKQLLFDGGKSLNETKRAEEQYLAAKFKYDVTSASIRRTLRLGFVDLLKAQRQVTIAEDILARRKQSTKLIRLRYEGGREHKGSLMTAEAKEAQAEFDLAQAKRNVGMAQSNMKDILGWPVNVSPDNLAVEGKFEIPSAGNEKPDFVQIAESTPLVKQLNAQSNIARYGVKTAKADFYPGVYASAGANRSSSDWPPDQDEWSMGLSLSFPLFEGGSRVASVERAKSTVRQAEAEEKSGFLSASALLQMKWIAMINAAERVVVRVKFLDAARERARIAEGQYSASLIVFDSWIIIEDDFVLADQSLLEAQASALTAEAEWVYAKGGTLENESK